MAVDAFIVPYGTFPMVKHRFRREIIRLALETPVVEVIEWTALDSTHIRVSFGAPLLNNAGLVCVDSYKVVPPVGAVQVAVLSVEPEDVEFPTYVVLTTTEMTDTVREGLDPYDGDVEALELA